MENYFYCQKCVHPVQNNYKCFTTNLKFKITTTNVSQQILNLNVIQWRIAGTKHDIFKVVYLENKIENNEFMSSFLFCK